MKRDFNARLFLDYCLYLLVRLADAIVNLLPEKVALATGRCVGRLVYVLFTNRREAALDNLTIAFGSEKPHEWIVRTARKSFEHFGMNAVEFFRIRRWTPEDIAKKLVIHGRLPLNLALMPGEHGVCVVTSHFGCFEVLAPVAKTLQLKGHVMVSILRNPFLSQYALTRGDGTGIKTHPDKGIVKLMIEFLRSGATFCCAADQRGDAERGIFVDFFGKKAPANEVFAKMMIDGNARVLPVCIYREDDGRYQCVWCDEPRFELSGNRKDDLTIVSQRLHNIFEEWLRFKPEQGLWLHSKYKRRPSRRRKSRG